MLSAVWSAGPFKMSVANSVDLDQTAPRGAVRSRSTLFVLDLDISIYIQQMTSADDTFRCMFFIARAGLKN